MKKVEVLSSESQALERASRSVTAADEVLAGARSAVVTAATYEVVNATLRAVKVLSKQVETERKALTDPLNGVVKRIMAKFKPATDALALAEKTLKGKLESYDAELKRKASEAAAKILREAEEAREREAEAQRKADKAKTPTARAAAEAEVRREGAKAGRREEKAAAVVLAAQATPEGLSFRETWHAEVFDLDALVAAVAAGRAPRGAVAADHGFLDAEARKVRAEGGFPGVRFVSRRSTVQS